MSAFKDILNEDAKRTFLNVEEFSENYYVNGIKMPIMFDNNELIDRQARGAKHTEGMFTNELLFYVSEGSFGKAPFVNSIIRIGKTLENQKSYIVTNATNEDGIYSITAEVTEI